VAVAVGRVKEHPLYRKKFTITRKYLAHDETGSYKIGDLVEIAESRPLSKRKRWTVTRKLTTEELES
jgi:small subunit ribosomal protein S17